MKLAAAILALMATVAADGSPGPGGPMRVVAGNGTEGFADGTGEAARFRKPIRLAALGPDSVVVADIYNHAIREVALDGRVRTIVGGPDRKGFRDGPADDAQIRRVRDGRVETVAGAEKGAFTYPMDVAFAPDGTLLIADAGANLVPLR